MSARQIFVAVLLCLVSSGAMTAGSAAEFQVREYRGIRPTDPEGRNGLANPERGFRWENRIASQNPKWLDHVWTNAIKVCSDDGITVTQGYCELLDYCEQERIPEDKIQLLQNSFDAARKNGLKFQLAFRYEMNNERDKKGPTEDIILSHIKQLAPVIQKNIDVVAILQTGFVGLYGEWHRSWHGLDKNEDAQERILTALLKMLPPERKMVLRYPRHKNAFIKRVTGINKDYVPLKLRDAHSMKSAARIGYCDHGFMVQKNDAGTFSPPPSPDYDYITRESLFVPVDGEFFWVWSKYGLLKDDGLVAARRFWDWHFTVFSYVHNHSCGEGGQWKEKKGARYSLDEWKEEEITPEFLKQNHMPISDSYFSDEEGKPLRRNIFEYVRDHLGYRLELQKAGFPASMTPNEKLKIKVSLVNRGFAAPINPRPVQFVLIGKDRVFELPPVKCDVRKWYPCDPVKRRKLAPVYILEKTAALPEGITEGEYELGIWLPDLATSLRYDQRYAVRMANGDSKWFESSDGRYGVNILGNIKVKQ